MKYVLTFLAGAVVGIYITDGFKKFNRTVIGDTKATEGHLETPPVETPPKK